MRRLSIRLSKEQADISVLTKKQAHLIASERNEMSYPFSLTSRNFSNKLYITKHIYVHINFLAQIHVGIFVNIVV